MVLDGTGSVYDDTGWYLVSLSWYCLVLGGRGSAKGLDACIYWVNLAMGTKGETPAQIIWHIGVKKKWYKLSKLGGRGKGWGQSAKLGTHSAICSKLGTALQAYTLNPCTKFAANPTSRKVNT